MVQVLQGALLMAAMWVRHERVKTEGARTVTSIEAVQTAERRLQRHLVLDLHCVRSGLDIVGRPTTTQQWKSMWTPVVNASRLADGVVEVQIDEG